MGQINVVQGPVVLWDVLPVPTSHAYRYASKSLKHAMFLLEAERKQDCSEMLQQPAGTNLATQKTAVDSVDTV